jgi:PAS domain S-box-containing protein
VKISQKMFIGFTAIAIAITLFSIFTISLIKNELKEVGDFHSHSLYLIQNLETKTTEAVKDSFAYIVSGEPRNKEAFLAWVAKNNSINEKFQKLEKSYEHKEEIDLLETINLEQIALNEKAKEVFIEFDSKGYVSSKLFNEYENIVDRLLHFYQKATETEKEEVVAEQKKAVKLMERTIANITGIRLIIIFLAIFSSYFIAKSISVSVKRLKLATVEVAKGNLDTLIEVKKKDEIGELAFSFSHMTEKRNFREELLAVKNYTDNIIRSMSEALLVISTEGKIITANQAICALLKYEENELIGQPFERLCLKEEVQLDEAEIDKLIETGCANKFETIYVAKDGSKIPVFFSSSLMFDDNKQIQGIVCVAQDITECKQAEVEIRAALEKEKQLGELKSRFITMASHEFRTPLATILSSTELLEHYSYKWSEEKKLQHFQRIQVAVKHMTGLLKMCY